MTTAAIAPAQAGDADPVVALRQVVTGETWSLDATAGTITIGSAGICGVRVGDIGVSAEHAQLVRHGAGWRLVDRSRNGTFVAGQRVAMLDLDVGARFELARTPMLAASLPMMKAAARLGLLLGLDQPGAVSMAMAAAEREAPIAIVGPPGNGQHDLVRVVHGISRRRGQPLIELTGSAAISTWQRVRNVPQAMAYLDLPTCQYGDAVNAARRGLAGDARWRWVFAGTSEAQIAGALRLPHLRGAHLIVLGRLDERADDRRALVDRLLAETAPVTVAELPARAVKLLTAPRAFASLDDLRVVTRRVAWLAMAGVSSSAAVSLQLHPEHLALFAEKYGFPPGPRR